MTVIMKDIAREAGVSVITVSRAINNKPDINPETRKHILKIVHRLHYAPNHLAKSLVVRKSKTIGILIPDNVDPFYAAIVQGIGDECRERGYGIFLWNTHDDPDAELEYLQRAREKRADGILIYPVQADHRYLKEISHGVVPCVFLNRHPESAGYDYVINDNVYGAFSAVNHLIQRGHKDITYICPKSTASSTQERIHGCKKAVSENNVPSVVLRIVNCEERIDSCYGLVKDIIAENKRPTALFVWDDRLAIGAMKAVLEAGLSIPHDIAIVGYDDIEISAYLYPPLTTVRQPTHQIGQTAARVLLNKLEGKDRVNVEHIVLKPELIVRKTT